MKTKILVLSFSISFMGVAFHGCSKNESAVEIIKEETENGNDDSNKNTGGTGDVGEKTDSTNKNKQQNNHWKCGNTEYKLTSCVVAEYGNRSSKAYDLEVHLYTGSLVENEKGQLTGQGHFLRLSLISAQSSLAEGIYKHSNLDTCAGTLEDMRTGYQMGYEEGVSKNNFMQFKAGQVEVKKVNKSYEIIFTLISDQGCEMSGVYKCEEGSYIIYKR